MFGDAAVMWALDPAKEGAAESCEPMGLSSLALTLEGFCGNSRSSAGPFHPLVTDR